MKLYTKTLFYFIGVIALEAGLTAFLVTRVVRAANLDDAHRELKYEATAAYESFNAWKRSLWTQLMLVSGDAPLQAAVSDPGGNPFVEVTRRVQELLLRTGLDMAIVTAEDGTASAVVQLTSRMTTVEEPDKLRVDRDHPFIRVLALGDKLVMAGSVRFTAANGERLDVSILKVIDSQLCDSLALDRGSRVVFFGDGALAVGPKELAALSSSVAMPSPTRLYRESYGVGIASGSYNVAAQRIPGSVSESEVGSLVLVTLRSDLPYRERIATIGRIVLFVSVASAFLTLLLSLALTAGITGPIRMLVGSMRRFQKGLYTPRQNHYREDEIGQLLRGFDEMAGDLHRDRRQMRKYIGEITHLKDFSEKVIESIQAGILILGAKGEIWKSNSAFRAFFGATDSDLVGRRISEVPHGVLDPSVGRAVERFRRGHEVGYSTVTRARGGKVFEVKLYPLEYGPSAAAGRHGAVKNAGGCVVVVEDVSRKVELEEKILQAEKLSSLSMLSAGVAHEINNPLSSIMTNVQYLIDEERDPDRATALKLIEQETRRIARTVQELLRFASTNAPSQARCDLNETIEQGVDLIGYSLRRSPRITVETSLAQGLPDAGIREDELKQIVINLLANSAQAIEGSGTITVTSAPAPDGEHILLRVSDDGKGISPEALPHIFDPFYTTKHDGEGTGLGLSVVYGILKKRRGAISVESLEGKGTTMIVTLPAATRRSGTRRRIA